MRYSGNALPKKVYPYSYEEARARGQTAQHRRSYRLNVECALSIRAASSLNLANGHVPLENVREVLEDYGPERVMWVLANTIQQRGSDTRYTEDSRRWAENFPIPADSYKNGDLRFGYLIEGWPPHVVEFLDLARAEIAAMRQAETQKRQKKAKEKTTGEKQAKEKQEEKQSIRKQLTVYKQSEIEKKYGMVGECGKEVR